MTTGRLQQELKKREPFVLLEQEVLLNLWRTADQLQIRFTRLLREHGLTMSQYNILRILRGAEAPLPILEIASRTITMVPGITGLIDRLERAKLVLRARSGNDRRIIFVRITPAAEQILAALDQPILELHRSVLGHMSDAELKNLSTLLEKARNGDEME